MKWIFNCIGNVIGGVLIGAGVWLWAYFDEINALSKYSTTLTEALALPLRKYCFIGLGIGILVSVLVGADD